jgi:hypothetical protein
VVDAGLPREPEATFHASAEYGRDRVADADSDADSGVLTAG